MFPQSFPGNFVPVLGRTGETTYQVPLIDVITHKLIAIDEVHNEIHDGDTFRYFDAVTINSGSSQDYLITTPNTKKWAHFLFLVDGTAITTISLYEATDKTGTTGQTIFNANRNSSTTATVTVDKGTSGGTTDGTLLFTYSSGTATGSVGKTGADTHNDEWILKQNTKYILRIASGTAGNLCNLSLSWYEHESLTA